MFHPSTPPTDYARPELRALLDQGVDPLIAWLRTLSDAPPTLGFHAPSAWDSNVLACYLAHYLPGLPPDGQWRQDVLVVHFPEYEENDAYNRIFTQYSGNCLIPDDFHAFLLALTRTFGTRFIPAWELLSWLEHGKAPEHLVREQEMAPKQRLLEAVASVEARTGGVIERSTITVLNPSSTLEWMGILTVMRDGSPHLRALHVRGEQVEMFDNGLQDSAVARWFDEMRDRAYLPRWQSSEPHRPPPGPHTLSAVTAEGQSIALFGPLSDLQLATLAGQIREVQANRAILAFLAEVWGVQEANARVQLTTVQSRGEEAKAISACQVWDARDLRCLPDLHLPFWQEHLDRDADLKADLDACESDEERLAVLNTFLFRGFCFKEASLPDPKGEHPVFAHKVRLWSLAATFPCLYQAEEPPRSRRIPT